VVALAQLPARIRPAFKALWNLDLALADVVATSTDPNLAAIRLAWWRERLEELDQGAEPPAEPRLRDVARELLARGVAGAELSRLEDAWLPLLDAFPWGEPQADGLRLRGRTLFAIGAKLLGCDGRDAEAAGALWSLADGAEHCSDPNSREFMLAEARRVELPAKFPRKMRPLTVLGALASHDLWRSGAGAGRVAAALAHRLRGTIPDQV
jgi:phytoene synthase